MVFLDKTSVCILTFILFASCKELFPQAKNEDTLKVTSWNLHLLPSPVFLRSRKKHRTTQIITFFNQNKIDNDILLFQEVFHKKRRKQLITGLRENYPYFTATVNPPKGKLLKTNSGLIMFSKYPLDNIQSIKFEDCSGSDCMANKGAQMASIDYNDKTIYILNTHLNSEPPREIAINQMKHIRDSLIIKANLSSPYVFISGDFNINVNDTVNYQKMIRVFKTKNKRHYDLTKKKVRKVTETLDYIFLYNSLESKLKINTYKFLIGPEWTKGQSKKVYGKTVGLSDHYPVKSIIVFKE